MFLALFALFSRQLRDLSKIFLFELIFSQRRMTQSKSRTLSFFKGFIQSSYICLKFTRNVSDRASSLTWTQGLNQNDAKWVKNIGWHKDSNPLPRSSYSLPSCLGYYILFACFASLWSNRLFPCLVATNLGRTFKWSSTNPWDISLANPECVNPVRVCAAA